MKKLSKLLALAAGLSTLFFAACSDISGDASGSISTGVNDKTASAKDYNVQFFAEDGNALDLTKWGVYDETTNSKRTIVADGLKDNLIDTDKTVFYLWGTNQLNTSDNSITNPKTVTFTLNDDDTTKSSGKVTLGLSASKWNLTLAAVNKTKLATLVTGGNDPTAQNIKDSAYYIGYANVDLRSADSIKFYLFADGLTGSGTATIRFIYDGLTDDGGTWTTDHVNLVKDTSKYTVSARVTSRLASVNPETDNTQSLDTTNFFTTTVSDTDKKTWELSPGT